MDKINIFEVLKLKIELINTMDFIESENLQFKAYTNFDKQALLEWQELYEEIAKKIWGIYHLEEQIN